MLVLFFALCSGAGGVVMDSARAEAPPVRITSAWIRLVPGFMTGTAAYLTLENETSQPIRLVGGTSPIASSIRVMITTHQGDDSHSMVGMKDVEALVIPPHGSLKLQPNGDHLMVEGLKSPLREGDRVPLTIFLDSPKYQIPLSLPVARKPPQ